MKEKLSRLALSFALAIALYAAFLPTASADDVAASLHVAVDGTGADLFSAFFARFFNAWMWGRLNPSSRRKAPCPPPAQKPTIPAS